MTRSSWSQNSKMYGSLLQSAACLCFCVTVTSALLLSSVHAAADAQAHLTKETELLESGLAFEQEIQGCVSEGTNTSLEEQDLASVSYYIAQGLGPINSSILAPVPCVSRITVTSAETGAWVTARITRVCKYCRNKLIGLSPSTFLKLGLAAAANASEVEVVWRIDVLRSREEGNSAPADSGTETFAAFFNVMQADINDVVWRLKSKNSLRLNEACEVADELARKQVKHGDYGHLFQPPGTLTPFLNLRYLFERMNRLPGQNCDEYQDLICTYRQKCQCDPTYVPLPPRSRSTFDCVSSAGSKACMVDLRSLPLEAQTGDVFASPRTGECVPTVDICARIRLGAEKCVPEYRKKLTARDEHGRQRVAPSILRFNATDGDGCLCMESSILNSFIAVSHMGYATLKIFSEISTLEFGARCDPAAEKLKTDVSLDLTGMDRQLNPGVFLNSSDYVFNEFAARVDVAKALEQLMDSNLTLCKTYERLACNDSGVCDCYSNPTDHVELVREAGGCVLKRDSICDPAYWDGRLENYIDEYEEDSPKPACQGSLPCVDMRTGKLCPRNDSFVTVSFKYKFFPFLHMPFEAQDPEAFNLKLEDYCRCHEPFEPGDGGMEIWLPILAASLGALALVFLGTVVRYRRRLREWDMERQKFLKGDPKLLDEHELGEQTSDGAVRAQLLPYDQKHEIDPKDLDYEPLSVRGGRLHRTDLGIEEYQILKRYRLGYGGFGVAVRGTLQKDGVEMQVAIKTCENAHDRLAISSIRAEIKILSYIGQHPNMVEFIGAQAARVEIPKLILELCSHGSLKTFLGRVSENWLLFLSQTANDKFDPNYLGCLNYPRNWIINTTNLLCWSYQVANGMEYLGSKSVVHGDLFLKNVLLASNGVAKVTDFGLAQRFAYKDNKPYVHINDALGPLDRLLPPEACTEPRKLSPAVDAWTFGVLLWEMFSFASQKPEPAENCTNSAEELKQPSYSTTTIHAISRLCWVVDLSQRIGFEDLKKEIRRLLGDAVDPAAECDIPENLRPRNMNTFTIQEPNLCFGSFHEELGLSCSH